MLPSDILRRDGWCQGQTVDEQGKRCLVGAIMDTASKDWGALYQAVGRRHIGYVQWNDARGRTAAEVIALLEEVEYELGLRTPDWPVEPALQPDAPRKVKVAS